MNFEIKSNLPISRLFLERGITTFIDACDYVKNLSYGRNENKQDLTTVFSENMGTCSTKHALLRQLAIENNVDEVRLILGLFKMTKANTPEVAINLTEYCLDYIPEAHNYLKVNGEIIDCTKHNSSKKGFIDDLLCEIEIEPNQISEFKLNYHQTILRDWLLDNLDKKMNFDELWRIREKCISDLSLGVNANH